MSALDRPRRGSSYGPNPEYQRWYRAIYIHRYGRRRDRWRQEEDALALDMRARDKSYAQISFRVRRTPDAVAARLKYLGAREAGR